MSSPVEQELRKIIAANGYSVCREHRRVESILRDLCAPYRWEVSVLASALSEGVASDLLDWQDTFSADIMVARLTKRLQSNRGLTEKAAKWAVETLARILVEPSRGIGNRRYDFAGAGESTSGPFDLDAGLVVFEGTQVGRENFFVELFDSANRHIKLIFNEIGRCHSRRPIGISAFGSYYLRIRADGDWKIDVRQSRPVIVESIPFRLSGSGQSSSPFVELESPTRCIEATHIGIDNIAVTLLSSGGQYRDLLINEVGDCTVRRAFQVRETAVYILDISSTGDWTIALT
jgi:hypothetical protein